MSDFISRQDAIEAVYQALRTPVSDYKNNFFHDSMSLAVEIVKNIPFAEPERKTGKWIFHIDNLFPEESTQECSVCHEEESIKIQNDNFCPNCGAKMKK